MKYLIRAAHERHHGVIPFLDPKKIATTILLKKQSEPSYSEVKDEKPDPESSSLHSACQDILMAIDKKSASDLAEALKFAFQELDKTGDE